MRGKKTSERFTVLFDLDNPKHRNVVDILNERGRGKAAFIADAICVYESVMSGCNVYTQKPHNESVSQVRPGASIAHSLPTEGDEDVWDAVDAAMNAFL